MAKYGIYRHENALGNSAEQTVNLCQFIQKNNDSKPIIYVETEFQRDFTLCIPRVKSENIHFYDRSKLNVEDLRSEMSNPFLQDVYMPDVYFSILPYHYPSVWMDLKGFQHHLRFPFEIYENKFNLPEKSIVIQLREANTYWKRIDGSNCEPHRNVDIKTFFDLALYFANQGYKVVRIGDPKQTPMPKHENILDFAKVEDKRMLDDLYLVATSKVFLSCDSGIWPMAGGMHKNLVLSNVTSTQFHGNKSFITDWLLKETSIVIPKERRGNCFIDNSLETLISAVNRFI